MKRRAILLMVTIGAAVLLASGVALAETVSCDNIPPCYGSPEADTITGTANGETILAMGGTDSVFAAGATTPSMVPRATTTSYEAKEATIPFTVVAVTT